MPTTEADLAARIDSTGLLGTDGKPKERAAAPAAKPQTRQAPPSAPEPEDETTEAETDETIETADESEDLSTEATEREAGASDDVKELRREIADLKALLGKNRNAASTDEAGGAAAPSADSAKTAAAFTKVREKLAKAKDTWGELIDAVGLNDLVDELEADRAQQIQSREEAEQNERITAANNVHRAMNNLARGNPALMKAIGIGLHGTIKPEHMDTRRRIFAAATRAMEDAQDEMHAGTRAKAMTESEAIAIGIRRVTGQETGSSTDASAKDRARMVRPIGGTTTAAARTTETQEQVEARLAARADEFLKHSR